MKNVWTLAFGLALVAALAGGCGRSSGSVTAEEKAAMTAPPLPIPADERQQRIEQAAQLRAAQDAARPKN